MGIKFWVFDPYTSDGKFAIILYVRKIGAICALPRRIYRMASLSLRHIYKKYPGGVTAVSDFNLEIKDTCLFLVDLGLDTES